MVFPVLAGADAVQGFEDPVEVGDIAEAHFVRYAGDWLFRGAQQLAGGLNAYLVQGLLKVHSGNDREYALCGWKYHLCLSLP